EGDSTRIPAYAGQGHRRRIGVWTWSGRRLQCAVDPCDRRDTFGGRDRGVAGRPVVSPVGEDAFALDAAARSRRIARGGGVFARLGEEARVSRRAFVWRTAGVDSRVGRSEGRGGAAVVFVSAASA